MRETIFRGKRVDNGEWVYGDLIHEPFGYCIQYLEEKEGVYRRCKAKVIPETVGQYTGLQDKNGKQIFEWDIVVCKQEIESTHIDYHIESGFVEMKHGAFGLHRTQGYYRPFKDWLENYEYEIIGNIHDNPELLGGAVICD